MSPESSLRLIKLIHTLVWAVFAGSIVAIPVFAFRGDISTACWLIALVFVEVLILVVNRMRCPLTDVAARYTAERHANFDIYLPLWLARYNKQIFGALYVAGIAYTWVKWTRATD